MSKLTEKIPGLLGLLLVVVSILIVLMVYLGGNADSILNAAGEAMTVPKYTDTLLFWIYILFGAALVFTVGLALLGFVKSLIANPVSALKSLVPIVLFALVFVVSWNLGSEEKMSIIGYDGTGNEGVWAKFTDMVIYSIYALFGALALTIVGARIYTAIK